MMEIEKLSEDTETVRGTDKEEGIDKKMKNERNKSQREMEDSEEQKSAERTTARQRNTKEKDRRGEFAVSLRITI